LLFPESAKRRPNLAVLFVVASGWALAQAKPPAQPQAVAAPHPTPSAA
jgi:hypothetical protein